VVDCLSPALMVPAVDTAPSTDAERSLTLPQIRRCRRSLPSTSVDSTVVYIALSTDAERSCRSANVDDLCRRYCTVHRRRAFRHASSRPPTHGDVVCVIYVSISLSVARSPLIYRPATQTTKESHHVGFILQRPRAGEYQILECWPRAVCSRSTVIPRVYF